MADERIQNVIRLAKTDLDGGKPLAQAMQDIKGVSHRLANSICTVADVDPNTKLSEISDDDKEKIEEVIDNPKEHGITEWLLNRRKDPVEGSDRHVIGPDLELAVMDDINRLKKINAYRGVRHKKGLPVRGQKTRTSFRGDAAVGVARERVQSEAAEEGESGGGEEEESEE